ncbi:hypothetical protein KBD59_02095 [Candidatus Gracilibacteria bacterium]|nr:hypothetical protein [Candidatus Gracilibacteria bacterium]
MGNTDRRTFTAEEILKCPENETCCQCGLCCFGFQLQVPERRPDSVRDAVRTQVKNAGEMCPHANDTPDGRVACSLQDMKEHHTLRVCAQFNGGDPDEMFDERGYNPRRTGYFEAIQSSFHAMLEYPDDEGTISMFLDFCQRGVIQMPILLQYVRNHSSMEKITRFLKVMLLKPVLLTEILDKIEDLPSWLKLPCSPTSDTLRWQTLDLDCASNPNHAIFFSRYIENSK